MFKKKKNYVEVVEAVEAEVTDVINIPKKEEEKNMGTKNTAKVVKMIGAGVAGAGALGLAVWKIFFDKKEDPDSDLSCEEEYYEDASDEAQAADEEDFEEE